MGRRLLAVATVAFALLFPGLTYFPSSAATSDLSPAAEEGFAQISQCLQSRSNLAVLLVVDESSSLQGTDPDNKRARLLANLVRSLGRQAGRPTANGERRIDLAVSSFSYDYRPLIPWTKLDSSSTESIADQLEQQVPQLNQGQGTDHRKALSGARGQMAKTAATSGAEPPCQLTIMFTDGVLSLGTPADEQAATEQMCRPGGLVDGLRRDQINLITVMLFDQATADANPGAYKRGRQLLQATAEGRAGGLQCGRTPIPPQDARGAYLEGNVNRLASLFAGAFARSQGSTPIDRTGSPVTVTIDPGIASFSVVAAAPKGIALDGPSGQKYDIAVDGRGDDQAVAVWDFDTVTVDIPVTPEGQGEWTISRPGQTDPVTVFLNTGLGLQLDKTPLVTDEPAEVTGRVVKPGTNSPVDLSVYRSAEMTANAVGAAADPLVVDSDGSFRGTITPQGDGSTVQIDVTLNLTTQSGQELQPVSGRFALPVTLPKEFPQVTPAALTLTSLEGVDGQATGTATVTGSAEGPTKVCATDISWSGVDDPSRYTTQQTSGCFDLQPGQTRQLDVTVTTSDPTDERVTGTMPLQLSSATGTERDFAVPVSFTSLRPVNEAVRYGVVAILALLAIALPLLMLYMVNRSLARFRVLPGSRWVALPVTVSRSGVKSRVPVGAGGADGGDVFEIPPDRLSIVPPTDKPPREMPGPDGCTLRTRMPRLLLGSPTAEVVAPPGHRVFSNQAPYSQDNGEAAPVTMGMGDVWYVTVPDSELTGKDLDAGVTGILSAVIPPTGAGQSVTGIAAKIRSFPRYGNLLDRMRSDAALDASSVAGDTPAPGTVGGSRPGPGAGPAGPQAPTGPRSGGPTGPTSPSGSSGPSGPGSPRPAGPTSPSTGRRASGAPSSPGGSTPSGPGGPSPRSPGASGPASPRPSRPSGPSGPSRPSGPGGTSGPGGPSRPTGPSGPRGPGGS